MPTEAENQLVAVSREGAGFTGAWRGWDVQTKDHVTRQVLAEVGQVFGVQRAVPDPEIVPPFDRGAVGTNHHAAACQVIPCLVVGSGAADHITATASGAGSRHPRQHEQEQEDLNDSIPRLLGHGVVLLSRAADR